MAVERIHIAQFMELAKLHPVLDVRSPAEYAHAHVPGAISMPLFSDEERKQVGTAYKQQSREQAIKIGLDFFGPKMRKMVERAEGLFTGNSTNPAGAKNLPDTILVYCWRGGMRSGAVSWLLDMYGFKVYTLAGGYKKFRHYVLDSFSLPFEVKVLGGYTGSGKTESLKELGKYNQAFIDLEGLANHKGSAFGNIGLPPQPSQEMFENILAMELQRVLLKFPGKTIWLEDESQRIGLVNLPAALWSRMRKASIYFLDIPFEERLKHIVEEYGCMERQRVIDAIGRIKEKLGGLNAKTAIELLEQENTIESFRILLKYYDRFYLKALHNREGLNSLLHTIECNTVTPENAIRLVAEPEYQHEKP